MTANSVSLNIKIAFIENLIEYSQALKLSDFEIKITHEHFEIKPLANNSGFIHICPFQSNNEEIESTLKHGGCSTQYDTKMNLDFSYNIDVNPADIKELNRLIDAPILVSLLRITETKSGHLLAEKSAVSSESIKNSSALKLGDENEKTKNLESNSQMADITPSVQMIPLAYACIDLMNYIHDKPIRETIELYLYPITIYANLKTPIITIDISCTAPLCQIETQKRLNSMTITLENIFNPPQQALSPKTQIFVDLKWVVKTYDKGLYDTKPIVTFSNGTICKYYPNNLFKKWNRLSNINCIGIRTPLEVSDSIIGVYNTKKVDVAVIDADTPVLRYNSIYREILISEDFEKIKNLILEVDEQISVEIRLEDTEEGDESIYLGTVDISPMLFPDVKTGRFVIPIKKFSQPGKVPTEKHDEKGLRSKLGFTTPSKEEYIDQYLSSQDALQSKPTGVLLATTKQKGHASELNSKYCLASMIESPLDENTFVILEISFEAPITKWQTNEIVTSQMKSSASDPHSNDGQNLKYKIETLEEEFENHLVDVFENLTSNREIVSIINDTQSTVHEKIDKIPFLGEIQANMVNTIMKLVAVKYNRVRHTTDNERFKDLMSIVYNDLSDQIIKTSNAYYSGYYNSIKFKDGDCKDLYIWMAKEFREFGYSRISERIYQQILDSPEMYEEKIIDLAIDDLQQFRYENAAVKVEELLLRSPKNIYGLIIHAYLEYCTSIVLGNLHSNLLTMVIKYPDNVEIWTLLYALYKQQNDRAGYTHSEMMFTKNSAQNLEWLPFFSARKELYFEPCFDESTLKNCIYIFLKLGTYKFAQILYEALEERLSENDRIIVTSTMYLSLKQYEKGRDNLLNFKQTSENKMLLRLYKGHFLYALKKEADAILEYQVVYHSAESNLSNQLATLRCGFWDLKERKNETAKTYFSHCSQKMGTFLSWFGLGVSFFRTNQLHEAKACFTKATDLYQQFSEVWTYLVMVHLKQNKREEAVECYKQAGKYSEKDGELWNEMVNCFHDVNVPLPESF